MKNKYLFVLVLFLALSLLGYGFVRGYGSRGKSESREMEDVTIVTSFYPMQIAAMNVVGDCDGVTVECLSEPQTGCLHDYQMTPQDMILLSHADVFIVNGGGIEGFLEEVAREYPKLVIINAGETVFSQESHGQENIHSEPEEERREDTFLEEEHGEDTSEVEHSHPENAHAWMSISCYKQQIESICAGLEQADPAHREVYQKNRDAYLVKIRELESLAEEVKESAAGTPVVILHEAYEYLARELKMEVEGLLNLDEERQVSAGETADIINTVRDHGIRILLAEELYGRDMGRAVEQETGCKAYYLDTLVRGEVTADAWLTGMEENLRILQEALCAK